MDIRFEKYGGLTTVTGRYASEKSQVMDVICRDDELYCSIDWGNNAPQTNGWLRAATSGQTILQGFQWQQNVSLMFKDGSLSEITIVDTVFHRTKEHPTARDAEQTDEREPDRPAGSLRSENFPTTALSSSLGD